MTVLHLVFLIDFIERFLIGLRRTKAINKIVTTFEKYLILKQLTAAVLCDYFSLLFSGYLKKNIHMRKQ